MSKIKRGNYYKIKTREWFLDRGYKVELLEINYPVFNKGKVFFIKKDILCSDGVAYNDKEFILWNSKSVVDKKYISKEKSRGINDYNTLIVPLFIKKQLFIWQSRKEPIIIELSTV